MWAERGAAQNPRLQPWQQRLGSGGRGSATPPWAASSGGAGGGNNSASNNTSHTNHTNSPAQQWGQNQSQQQRRSSSTSSDHNDGTPPHNSNDTTHNAHPHNVSTTPPLRPQPDPSRPTGAPLTRTPSAPRTYPDYEAMSGDEIAEVHVALQGPLAYLHPYHDDYYRLHLRLQRGEEASLPLNCLPFSNPPPIEHRIPAAVRAPRPLLPLPPQVHSAGGSNSGGSANSSPTHHQGSGADDWESDFGVRHAVEELFQDVLRVSDLGFALAQVAYQQQQPNNQTATDASSTNAVIALVERAEAEMMAVGAKFLQRLELGGGEDDDEGETVLYRPTSGIGGSSTGPIAALVRCLKGVKVLSRAVSCLPARHGTVVLGEILGEWPAVSATLTRDGSTGVRARLVRECCSGIDRFGLSEIVALMQRVAGNVNDIGQLLNLLQDTTAAALLTSLLERAAVLTEQTPAPPSGVAGLEKIGSNASSAANAGNSPVTSPLAIPPPMGPLSFSAPAPRQEMVWIERWAALFSQLHGAVFDSFARIADSLGSKDADAARALFRALYRNSSPPERSLLKEELKESTLAVSWS